VLPRPLQTGGLAQRIARRIETLALGLIKSTEMNILSPDPGEAADGDYLARDGAGQIARPHEVIFPIVKQLQSGSLGLIGTGFFISDNGLFATAKHVLLDVFDEDGHQSAPIAIIHFTRGNRFILRPLVTSTFHDVADVAVGAVAQGVDPATGKPVKNRLLVMSPLRPSIGDEVVTYAYPKSIIRPEKNEFHFLPRYYTGKLEEVYPNGRDRVMMPAPCFRTSMNVYAGASGGPVFGLHGFAFGINSTSMDCSDSPISFVSRVIELLPLAIRHVQIAGEPQPSLPPTVRYLADKEFIIFQPPVDTIEKIWDARKDKTVQSIPFALFESDDENESK
jgi:hypothetical protein